MLRNRSRYGLQFKAYSPVEMLTLEFLQTSMHIHDNAAIFPDPRAFKPERWLPIETEGARLQKYRGYSRVADPNVL